MFSPTPKVVELTLCKHYAFMYENFVIATQGETYLLLEKHNDVVDVLCFDSTDIKYGSPNDEARGGHPLGKYGLGFYGFFEVKNSPWIREKMIANRVHHRHSDSLFDGKKHYIACFKGVILEVICNSYQEKQLSVFDVEALIKQQLDYLTE